MGDVENGVKGYGGRTGRMELSNTSVSKEAAGGRCENTGKGVMGPKFKP